MPLQMVRRIPTGARCDAILDPTDENLLAGGGLDEALHNAVEAGCRSVAIPLIAAGEAPGDRGLRSLCGVINAFLLEHELLVYLVISDRSDYRLDEALRREVAAFIDSSYVAPISALYATVEDPFEIGSPIEARLTPQSGVLCDCELPRFCDTADTHDELEEMLRGVKSRSFAVTLLRLIDEKGMDDVTCYKRANVDKKTFSKIKCNERYKPSKQTVIAFAIALRLSYDETRALLATVGFTLSGSSKFDVIIEYFIRRGRYDMTEINETLFEFDQVLLGC